MDEDPLDSFFSEIDQSAAQPRASSLEHCSSDDADATPLFPPPQRSAIASAPVPSAEPLPLVKQIYIESRELSCLSQDEIDDLRVKLGNITVHGLNVPAPIERWSQCGLPASAMSLIEHARFAAPTAIPCVLSGRDVIGCAVTGSGKTLAFVLPALLHVLAQPALRPNEALAIFLSPTRELAMQTHLEASRFLRLVGLRSTCLIGGDDAERQIKTLKAGAHIVVGTPGRFIDLTTSNRSFNLGRVGFFVVDEADRMFDLGFEPQVARIAALLRSDRQSMMFSATFPHIVERCARKLLSNPIEIVVGVRNVVSKDVEQSVEVIRADSKLRRLFQLLGQFAERGQSLVFTNTQEKAEEIFGQLVQRGYKVALLHGGMDQADRASIIHDFRIQRYAVLVLTSVGSRGLDIMSVVLVVNYDAPDHEADYVHRLGRTGRAGNHGWGVTFVEPLEKANAMEIMAAMKKSKAPIPPELEALCKTGDVKRKWGFGGHGFRFDRSEVIRFKQERKRQNDVKEDDVESEDDQIGATQPDSTSEGIKQRKDGKFVAEYVINDFPAKVRLNLTQRQNLEVVMDESGTTIIRRGVFVVLGSKAPVVERKLHLLIEGMSLYSVQVAMQNLNHLADDGTTKTDVARAKKYKVA
jgi:ATP-dependent RNA helicase DDX46/PRP5